jgi:hypothetical protein
MAAAGGLIASLPAKKSRNLLFNKLFIAFIPVLPSHFRKQVLTFDILF